MRHVPGGTHNVLAAAMHMAKAVHQQLLHTDAVDIAAGDCTLLASTSIRF